VRALGYIIQKTKKKKNTLALYSRHARAILASFGGLNFYGVGIVFFGGSDSFYGAGTVFFWGRDNIFWGRDSMFMGQG